MNTVLGLARLFPKNCVFLFLTGLLLQSLQVYGAESDVVRNLTEQNYKTLSGRVHEILKYRFQGLAMCDSAIQQTYSRALSSLPSYSSDRITVIKTLDLYLVSHRLPLACNYALDLAEKKFHDLERSRFGVYRFYLDFYCNDLSSSESQKKICLGEWNQVLADLDPHCISTQVPDPNGFKDQFPCLSGDYLIGKQLYSRVAPAFLLDEAKLFTTQLRTQLWNLRQGPQQEKRLELYTLFRGDRIDSSELRERFVALMTYFTSSKNSYSNLITGFHDQLWRTFLFDMKSAEQAVDFFNFTRLSVDEFNTAFKWGQGKGFSYAIGTQSLEGMNRHDFMAAYLACHYRNRSKLIRNFLPRLLGNAYETYDYITHRREGDSHQAAKENFKRDTRRYTDGVQWGYAFCQSAPGV